MQPPQNPARRGQGCLDLEAVVPGPGSDFPAGRPWLLQSELELTALLQEVPGWCWESINTEIIREGKSSMEMRGRTAAHGLCSGKMERKPSIQILQQLIGSVTGNMH